MAELALVLFDDADAQAWMPFVLTRPAGELRFGALTQRERAERILGAPCIGHLTAKRLMGFEEPGAAPVLDPAALPRDRDLILLSSRVVLSWHGQPALPPAGSAPLVVGDEICGWFLPAGAEPPPAEALLQPALFPMEGNEPVRLEGEILSRVWELITRNDEQIGRDIAGLFPGAASSPPPGVHVLGDHPLILGQGVSIEPGSLLDLRAGPIWLDDGCSVRAFTRLAGPAYVGKNTLVLGGGLAAVSIGPVCKIRGEVEECVILGYTNKAHDGYVGRSYVGSWVNLGALTTTSNLKNNYGTVRVWTPAGELETGEIKLGCLLGDHVKTGIGTLLNAGTVVGAGSNLFGSAMPPKFVPPFSWGTGSELVEYRLEKFLAVAEVVMKRRDVTLTPRQREMLRAAWHEGRSGL
jgi:UDP-N-acetylglucosamine diphosphorylase/glucosamine-1-phosphate N-acetyltransferase